MQWKNDDSVVKTIQQRLIMNTLLMNSQMEKIAEWNIPSFHQTDGKIT
jgi:hypothetical protein